MAIELSIVPASPDGNSFEIVPGDMTGMPDDDRLRFLQEAEEGRYSRLLAFQREPNEKSLIGDLESLQDCSSGVYILIQTERLQKNIAKSSPKHSKVFVGMTEDYGRVIGLYEKTKDADQGIEIFDPLLTLDQCLMEQNQKPPIGMSKWDLAVVVPEYENTALLYSMLLAIFEKAEGFNLRRTLNSKAQFNLRRMHNNHLYLLGSFEAKSMMFSLDQIPTDLSFWYCILCSVIFISKKIFGKGESSQKGKPGKPGEEDTISRESFQIDGDVIFDTTTHGDNSPINLQINNFYNFNADTLIKYLNNCVPPKPDTLSW